MTQTADGQLVESWIQGLSRPRPEFNNQPACPFARKALWSIVSCASAEALCKTLHQASLPLGHVLIIKVIADIAGLETIIQAANMALNLRDHIAMVSDPSKPINIDGYQTTQGHSTLVILQRQRELNSAREGLKRLGYYQNWSESALNRIGIERG